MTAEESKAIRLALKDTIIALATLIFTLDEIEKKAEESHETD